MPVPDAEDRRQNGTRHFQVLRRQRRPGGQAQARRIGGDRRRPGNIPLERRPPSTPPPRRPRPQDPRVPPRRRRIRAPREPDTWQLEPRRRGDDRLRAPGSSINTPERRPSRTDSGQSQSGVEDERARGIDQVIADHRRTRHHASLAAQRFRQGRRDDDIGRTSQPDSWTRPQPPRPRTPRPCASSTSISAR